MNREPLIVTLTIEGEAAQQLRENAKHDGVSVEQVVLASLVCDCCGALRCTCQCENDE